MFINYNTFIIHIIRHLHGDNILIRLLSRDIDDRVLFLFHFFFFVTDKNII